MFSWRLLKGVKWLTLFYDKTRYRSKSIGGSDNLQKQKPFFHSAVTMAGWRMKKKKETKKGHALMLHEGEKK